MPIQELFSSRNNHVTDVNQFVGQAGRLFFDMTTNTLRVSDGVTPGGVLVTAGGSGTANIGNLDISDTTITTKVTDTDIILDPTGTGSVVMYGNVVPGANVSYNLGAEGNEWLSLYVSTDTIYVGGKSLTVDDNNDVVVQGKVLTNGAAPVDASPKGSIYYTADGSTTTYELDKIVDITNALISINGLVQQSGSDYSITNSSLEFDEVPADNSLLEAVFFTDVAAVDHFTSNGEDATFSLSSTVFSSNKALVMLNGIVQRSSLHYRISGDTLTLGEVAPLYSKITVIHFNTDFNTQLITGIEGQDSYTLQNTLVSNRDILVTVNGLLQAYTSSYTVDGRTLTFADELLGGEIIIVTYFNSLANYEYLQLKLSGTVTAPVLDSDRWYPAREIIINSIDAYCATSATGDFVFKVYVHSEATNTSTAIVNPQSGNNNFTISNGTNRLLPITIGDIYLSPGDYLTYEITSGTAGNPTIRIRYK